MSENGPVSVAPMRELIAEEIRALMGRRKIGVSELARRIGISQPYLSRRLSGDVAIDVDDLDKIARELGVEMVDLMPKEGRLITTVRDGANQAQVSNARKRHLTERPRPNGHPNRTRPRDNTRRPVRLTAAHAPSVSGGRIPISTDHQQGVTYGA